MKQKLNIGVLGCSHGLYDGIYDESQNLNLLFLCGDLHTVRNANDLTCIKVPYKYLEPGDFPAYYNLTKRITVPTISVGGNHEASNYLFELYHGGYLCPDLYFMGYSGVIRCGNLRIAGISGIDKWYDYDKGYVVPFFATTDNYASVFHTRWFEVFKLSLLTGRVDVCMSHDWPSSACTPGAQRRGGALKNNFGWQASKGRLGSKAKGALLDQLKPRYWFSGHLHYDYATTVQHDAADDERSTRFVAAHKFKKGARRIKKFQIDVEADGDLDLDLYYDAEWLAISKVCSEFFPANVDKLYGSSMPDVDRTRIKALAAEYAGMDLRIPRDFVQCAPVYGEGGESEDWPVFYRNNQTVRFCERFGIKNNIE